MKTLIVIAFALGLSTAAFATDKAATMPATGSSVTAPTEAAPAPGAPAAHHAKKPTKKAH